jgi:hypothetical protein
MAVEPRHYEATVGVAVWTELQPQWAKSATSGLSTRMAQMVAQVGVVNGPMTSHGAGVERRAQTFPRRKLCSG